jgi:hypothetical protein
LSNKSDGLHTAHQLKSTTECTHYPAAVNF